MGKSTQKTAIIQTNIFDIPDSIIPQDKRLFYPNWDNRPPQQVSVIAMQGKRVLSTANLLAIVSKPGMGKSAVCEAIIAFLFNSKCDCLGFNVTLRGPRDKVLYIDTERSLQDTWNAWERTYRRAGIKAPIIDKRVIFANFKAVGILERKEHVETILKNNQDIGLIIFDGAGDFVRDTNSIPESSDFIDWINTFNPNISCVFTIHTNPRDDKPRGHLGSELCRRAESVFLVRKLEEGIREITTSFDYGKVRNDNDAISSFYRYSEDAQMFISTDTPAPKRIVTVEKEQKYKELIERVFEGRTECSATHIINEISNQFNLKEEAAKALFYRHVKKQLLTQTSTGYIVAN